MTVLRVHAENLAATRFALSPLAETIGALALLASGRRPAQLGVWVGRHRAAFHDLARDPVVAALGATLTSGARWMPDFLVPPPPGMHTRVRDELAVVAATPPERARADLALGAGGTCPPALDRPDVAERTASALSRVWNRLVEPDWARTRAVLERDVVHRAGLLATYGWARALDGLSARIRWLGDGRLEINRYDHPDRSVGDADVLLVPCSFGDGWLGIAPQQAYTIVYPARGIHAPATPAAHDSIDRLIGPTRSAVLRSLDGPATTSQLAAQLELSLATVSTHLAVLHAAGIVSRTRTGRSVLYARTDLGAGLLATAAAPHPR